MTTTKTKTPSHQRILNSYVTIAKLITLLEVSSLAPEVKTHCKTGLKVISILYADKHVNSGISNLSNKAFDGFYKHFPDVYFRNRGLLTMDMVIENIELCMQHDMLVEVSG